MFQKLSLLTLILSISSTGFAQSSFKDWVENQDILITLSQDSQQEALEIQNKAEGQLAKLEAKKSEIIAKMKKVPPRMKHKAEEKYREGMKKFEQNVKEIKADANKEINQIIEKNKALE